MKKFISFIANPYSGTSQKNNLDELIKKNLDFNKFEPRLQYTESAGHARVLAEEAIVMGADVIVAVGGDGTVNEVASSLVGTGKVLGILPGGSGNGFAMHLGLGRDMAKAIRILNEGEVMSVDTCIVNDEFFLNVSGLGFDAKIAYLTKNSRKRGFWHYFINTIKESRSFKCLDAELIIDEKNTIKGRFAAIAIANASMYGYNFTIAPTAALDDGLYDVMLIREAPVFRYFLTSYRFLDKSLHKSPLVHQFRCKTLRIKCAEESFYHYDGEGFRLEAGDDLSYRINEKSLNVLAPKQSQ